MKLFVSRTSQRRLALLGVFLSTAILTASAASRRQPLTLLPTDVLPTGNEWISLPDIRATDGALMTFNVLSMRDRGLLQAAGTDAGPVVEPFFEADGKPLAFRDPSWELIEYWIPTAHKTIDGLDATLTWCAPQGSRGAFLRLTLTNHRAKPIEATLGVRASFGSISRVTYVPVRLRGDRTVGSSPWVDPGEVFSHITSDTHFAWAIVHPEAKGETSIPPLSGEPSTEDSRSKTLQPGESVEQLFILGAGVEEFAAAHNARALMEMLERYGSDAILDRAAQWCAQRTKTTGDARLDLLMNRNYLFTELYAWGKTLDTEQTIGVTSRSPRYYVSAAYWDRDAMLWSFPALLDIDTAMAREALDYALTTQLRNTGTHSRFIDGVVLEDGFQLDEAAAPLLALGAYIQKTGDQEFLRSHRAAFESILNRVQERYDAAIGLYSSMQDSQDEFQPLPYITYDNALVWHALRDSASLYKLLGETERAAQLAARADALHAAVLKHCARTDAPGADGPIFASATDGAKSVFTEIPPGSLMKLPALGFLSEDDPVFARTYRWLHSPNYKYSYSNQSYGLPGSYRLKFTTSWEMADHLGLKAGHQQALKILNGTNWDGGIITEGVSAETGVMDSEGRAFATAAGYVAHAICQMACQNK